MPDPDTTAPQQSEPPQVTGGQSEGAKRSERHVDDHPIETVGVVGMEGVIGPGESASGMSLRRLDLSLQEAEANLALDEALLLEAEGSERPIETLRLWQFADAAVVIGRGSKIAGEVDLDYCRGASIPVLRRCSGGAAIVAGPGCLMYSVVLDLKLRPELRKVDEAHAWVMSRLAAAVRQQLEQVTWQGTCDLTFEGRKFSGNSLRIARHHLLYHGTILHDADLERIAMCLKTPPRQPDYREGRSHGDFVTNIPIDPRRLADDIAIAFEATSAAHGWPEQLMNELLDERYRSAAWHERH